MWLLLWKSCTVRVFWYKYPNTVYYIYFTRGMKNELKEWVPPSSLSFLYPSSSLFLSSFLYSISLTISLPLLPSLSPPSLLSLSLSFFLLILSPFSPLSYYSLPPLSILPSLSLFFPLSLYSSPSLYSSLSSLSLSPSSITIITFFLIDD